jgi:hypothetical protein
VVSDMEMLARDAHSPCAVSVPGNYYRDRSHLRVAGCHGRILVQTLDNCVARGDIFVTATGNLDVIRVRYGKNEGRRHRQQYIGTSITR